MFTHKTNHVLSRKWILSATEIETFDMCRRKWAYIYLDGIKPQPSKAAELGSSVHEFLKKYLTGNLIDYETTEGRIASAGLHFLPKRLSIENVERPVFFINNGLIFHGHVDFYEHVGGQTWLIGDHKTASNLARAFTEAELKKNTQANIYAQWAFNEKAAEIVKLRWVYYQTKSTPKALCIETELTRKEADVNFEKIAATADEILRIVKDNPPPLFSPKIPQLVSNMADALFMRSAKQLPQASPKSRSRAGCLRRISSKHRFICTWTACRRKAKSPMSALWSSLTFSNLSCSKFKQKRS